MTTQISNQSNPNNYYKVFTDGGSRGNPGPSGAGGVIFNYNKEIISEISEYLGIQTNNYAEYQGIILTLKKCIELNLNESLIMVFMDSLLVVNQINGKWKVKHSNLVPLHIEVKDLLKSFPRITFTHVLRHYNQHADKLVNKAINELVY